MSYKREIPVPAATLEKLHKNKGELWAMLFSSGRTPSGYTFWQWLRMINSGKCYSYEKKLLEEAGLWKE